MNFVSFYQEGSIKKIPFMLVANKTDIREDAKNQQKRVVEYEDGLRLSKVSCITAFFTAFTFN